MIGNKLPLRETLTRKSIAISLAAVAMFGVYENSAQASEQSLVPVIATKENNPEAYILGTTIDTNMSQVRLDKFVPRTTLENQINTMPDKLNKAFSNLTTVSTSKLKPGKYSMEKPVEAKGVIVADGAKYVFKHTYDKSPSSYKGFEVYSVDKYNINSGELEMSGMYTQDNEMLIVVIANGSEMLNYINIDANAYSDKELAKIAQVSQVLLNGVKSGN